MIVSHMVTTTEEKVRHARSLCQQGLWEQVLEFAQTWHTAEPADHRAWFYTGLGLAGRGQHAQAEIAYRRALELDPTDVKVWNNLGGMLFEHLRRPQDGIHCLEQTLKLNPRNKLGWLNLAGMLVKLGQAAKAMDCANTALALDEHLIEAWLCKAAAARLLGQSDVVRDVCGRLAAIKPEDFRPAR